MPKRELSKCREWERERRERLKTCFDALAKLLPSYDPTITPSKLEILQRAAAHITELQQKNKELLLGDQKCTAIAQRDEVRWLREKIKRLNCRNEQLGNLLRTAGLKIPKECLVKNTVFKGPPKLWSGKLSREKAEILRKKHENEIKTAEDPQKNALTRRKRKLSSANKKNSSENTPPCKKSAANRKTSSKRISKKVVSASGASSASSTANIASKVANILGPGTLILSNGNVVQVPPPVATAGTLHRIQLVPQVTNITQNSNPVILMQNSSKKISRNVSTINTTNFSDKLPVLRPKTIGNLKQNLLKPKVVIPALPKKKIDVKKTKKAQKTVNSNNDKSKKVESKRSENISKIQEKQDIEPKNNKNTSNPENNLKKTNVAADSDISENLNQSAEEKCKIDTPKSQAKKEINNQNSTKIIETNKSFENVTLKVSDNILESSEDPNIISDQNVPQNDSEIPQSNLNVPENSENVSKTNLEVSDNLQEEKNEQTSNYTTLTPPDLNKSQNIAHTAQTTLLELSNNSNIGSQITQSLENTSQIVSENLQNNSEHHEVIQNESAHLGSNEDHSELSNDIFASLGAPGDSSGVIGAQHSESMSPTAAFLLAFPLASTLTRNRISEGPNVLSGGANSVLNNNREGNNGSERNDQNSGESERESTPTTLYNLDNKNSTNRVLQITDPITVDTKNSRPIIHQINPLNNTRSTKNVLQPVKEIRNDFSRSLDNYNYYKDSLYCPNQENITSNSCANPRENNNQQNRENTVPQNFISNDNKDALISSVLQVSHACLYEGKQNNNFYNNSYLEMRSNDTQDQNSNYNIPKDNQSYLQTTKENVKSSSKSRAKLQNSRPPVNWMTSPDPRSSFTSTDPSLPVSTSAMTSDYFLPPFSDVYNTYSSSVSTEGHQNNDQNFSWTPSGSRSVLPTLLGDLALGGTTVTSVNNITSVSCSNITVNISKCVTATSSSNNYFNSFDPSSITSSTALIGSNNNNSIPQQNNSHQNVQNSSNISQNNPQTQISNHATQSQNNNNKEQSRNFLSVSSILVGPQKAHKRHLNNQGHQQNTKKREKLKSRSNNDNNSSTGSNLTQIGSNLAQTGTNLTSGGPNAISLQNNGANLSYEAQNKKYATGYSAEDLISDASQNYNNIPTYLSNLGTDSTGQQLYNHRGQNLSQNNHHQSGQNSQNIHNNSSRQNQSYQLNSTHSGHRQQSQQQQGAPFGATYPALGPQHGEFSALLSAAVVDSFVHVKPPSVASNGAHMGHTPSAGFDGYCSSMKNESGGHHRLHSSGPSDSDRRRHSRRSGPQSSSRDTLALNSVNATTTNTPGGFSELSFLSMSGAVSSPILQDDFHTSATFLNAPPPIPTPVASSLTNFNLSAIFPEINKSAPSSAAAPMWPHSKPSSSSNRGQSRYQNQQNVNNHSHENLHYREGSKSTGGYCHPQQSQHEGIYGAGGTSQSFTGILGHHQVQTPGDSRGPTNFSFSFAAP